MRSLAILALVFAACGGPSARPAPAPASPTGASASAPAATPADAPSIRSPLAALNLGFEAATGDQPAGWSSRDKDVLAAVTDEKRSGARSLRLRGGADGVRSASAKISAKPYVGKHLTLRGFIKTQDVPDGAALWLRADAATETGIAFDNMFNRKITGTVAWTAVRVEIDVPPSAETLLVGGLIIGPGTAWFDDLAIDVSEIKAPAQIAITGTVTGATGAPVAGAEVALIGPSDLEKRAQTDAAGRFRFDVLEGKWGISAHRPGGPEVGVFIDQEKYSASRDLKLALGKDGGVTVRGKVSRALAPGAYLQISPLSDHDSDLFPVPVAADGSFHAVLPRGDKYNVAVLDGFGEALFERKGDTATGVLEVPELGPPPADVVAYIGKQGIPLAAVEAGKGLDDMAPLAKLIGNARIVALGEATHGTREFFQLKHRLLEYMVAKLGFTVFAIEANQPECRAINDYVLHGKGDARTALAGIYFWTWNTEEVLAMIEWMRAWNADPAHEQKVQFTGFDMQASTVAYKSVADYLGRVAPGEAQALMEPIGALGRLRATAEVAKAAADARAKLVAGLAALTAAFDRNRKAWTAATSAQAFADARHDAVILSQAAKMYMAEGAAVFDARDAAMADNVGWLLEQTRAKIVVWAHNGHISNTLPSFTNMGSHLRKRYKRDYVNFGFVFGEGAFQALDFTKPARNLSEHTLPPPPEWNASVAFSRTGKPLLVLDLRALPARGPVRDWFYAPHPVRDTGAGFSGEKNMTYLQVLPRLYDAIIYVDKTTRARPLPPSQKQEAI